MATERGNPPPDEPTAGDPWAVDRVGIVLGGEPAPTERFLFGHGREFTLPHGEAVEIFPERQVVHLRARDFELTFTAAHATANTDAAEPYVAFRGADSAHGHILVLRGDGTFAFGPLELADPVDEAPPPPPAEQTSAQHLPASGPAEAGPGGEPSRIRFSGQVERAATFRTTPKGTRIARFAVITAHEDEPPDSRTVLAFNRLAERLERDPVQAGQEVEVIGYPHVREMTSNGRQTSVIEIYATAVRRPRTD